MRTHSTSGLVVDHRFKERKALNLDVVIYRHHIPVAVGKTRDIGTGGMGIVSDITNLKDYSLLEVEIRVNRSSRRIYHRLTGLVTHHNDNSFGITFTDLDASETEMLLQLMEQ